MLAIGLLSGGLDSTLAVKLVMDQGIEVVALKFTSPFCQCDSGGCNHAAEQARKMGIRLVTVNKGQEFLDVVRDPRFGRGSGMNPCIDCRIFMLRRASTIADELGAKFIFTGEVLDQRPMSQHRAAMMLIEAESGLEGKLLRPLSAKLLPETEAERMGWIDRRSLLAMSGRSRKPQIRLAAEVGVTDYPCPAGGCLLTSKEFALKLRDFLEHEPGRLTARDVALLKMGRHFRVNGYKVIIGRNEKENEMMRPYADDGFALLEPVSAPGPLGLCEGESPDLMGRAASMVARYSDYFGREVLVRLSARDERSLVWAVPAEQGWLEEHRIQSEPHMIRIA